MENRLRRQMSTMDESPILCGTEELASILMFGRVGEKTSSSTFIENVVNGIASFKRRQMVYLIQLGLAMRYVDAPLGKVSLLCLFEVVFLVSDTKKTSKRQIEKDKEALCLLQFVFLMSFCTFTFTFCTLHVVS